ncbi:hypothetical protein G6F16_014224 [Rhizopus arrhizus]|nr:hypothetical protein G6F23_015738 [Rhizopus arrhizus]KAG0772238.1 hypothetical protein G6F21_014525 [Rhizopus arrhizus]KAG0822489.1 hypothetical protein G6F17_014321 [Rhizopus arrhizus]KAG0847425.1 hypothetical protein G6F16_014224 [Rhizopus arrhizus]KAG1387867.1 hypothetical protein G6F58_013587 [Rhizopus delemar]
MLDLAQIHSLTLGYKWSPPKCAVLNAPTATSSRFVQMSLYGEGLPSVEEFTYLGVPFDATLDGTQPSRLPSAALFSSVRCVHTS